MKNIPITIKETFSRVKKEYNFYVALVKINKKYYVYRRSSRWDKEMRKRRSISEYLGRISSDGQYIKKDASVSQNSTKEIGDNSKKIKLTTTDQKLLTILSMNARADLTHLGKKLVGLKPATTFYRVRQLENKYKIKYIAEIDAEKLGYGEFLITVKFISARPKSDELKKVFSAEANVELAALTKGDFDVLLYVLAKNNEELKDIITRLRTGLLGKYDSIWSGLPIAKGFGFIPLRDEFIESLKEKLLFREYAVLKEVNKNSVADFQKIDEKYNFDRGRSDYTYHKLLKLGIIQRTTMNMENILVKYIATLFVWKINSEKFKQNRMRYLSDIIEERKGPINKCVFTADITDPDGALRIVPIMEEGELEKTIDTLLDLNLGIKVTANVITEILVGSFCYRAFDTNFSLQQRALERDYGIKTLMKVNYYETGRKRKISIVQNPRYGRI